MAAHRGRFKRAKQVFKDIEDAVTKFTAGAVEKALRIEATAMYGAFVASIPGETCLTQHNAAIRVDGFSGAITGAVLRNSRGGAKPFLDYTPVVVMPSSQIGLSKHRASKNGPASTPDNVKVKVVVHRGTGKRIVESGKKKLRVTFTTTRTAYDEPLMRAYMPQLKHPMDDYDVVAYQYENFSNAYEITFIPQYWYRASQAAAANVDTVPF